MRWAKPSTIAVLPTPGSPIKTGLFLVRRCKTWIARANLVVAANHRVQLAHAGPLRQVNAVLFQGFALPFRFSAAHVLTAPHGIDGRLQALSAHALLFGQTPRISPL
jgi:hypothetical protein